jgi:hypothetical protein
MFFKKEPVLPTRGLRILWRKYFGILGRVNTATYSSMGDDRFAYLRKSIDVRWFAVACSQFMIQDSRKGSFVFGKKFPYLPLNFLVCLSGVFIKLWTTAKIYKQVTGFIS